MNPNLYLEQSPIRADASAEVGKLPASIELRDLRDLGHPTIPARAIRAKCVDCSGGSETEARKCVAFRCPLWAFRMGRSPFHGRAAQ
jgi:hypothetical protein